MVFLAGTNTDGRHGAGSARYAYLHEGLVMGVGEGRSGNTYALPTVGHNLARMCYPEVAAHVWKFIQYATEHPNEQFQVTRVGCGLAGFKDSEIAILFDNAPENCYFDEAWKEFLPNKKFWGSF